MPTSGDNPYWDEVQKQLRKEASESGYIYTLFGCGHGAWGRPEKCHICRPICPRCGYDRPAGVEECRACSLFKDHAGTVGDAKRWHKGRALYGLRAQREQDRNEVNKFIHTLRGIVR